MCRARARQLHNQLEIGVCHHTKNLSISTCHDPNISSSSSTTPTTTIYQWWWLCSRLSSQPTPPAALPVAPAGKINCHFYLFVVFFCLIVFYLKEIWQQEKTIEICWSPSAHVAGQMLEWIALWIENLHRCCGCRGGRGAGCCPWLNQLLGIISSCIHTIYILVTYFGGLPERSIKSVCANWKIKWIPQPVIVVQWAQQWSPGSCSRRPDCLNINFFSISMQNKIDFNPIFLQKTSI